MLPPSFPGTETGFPGLTFYWACSFQVHWGVGPVTLSLSFKCSPLRAGGREFIQSDEQHMGSHPGALFIEISHRQDPVDILIHVLLFIMKHVHGQFAGP
jgi:hypothetical protein